MKRKLLKWLERIGFFLCLAGLCLWGVVQLEELMRPFRTELRAEEDPTADPWENGRELLSPACFYYTRTEGGYCLAEPGSEPYTALKELTLSLLELTRSAGNGRAASPRELFQGQTAICCRFRCPLDRKLLVALGFPEGICEALPEEGVRELWLLPASLYWQDNSFVFVSREADFYWKLNVSAERRGADFQRLLDRAAELGSGARGPYLCAQESYGLGGDALFLEPDAPAAMKNTLLRNGSFVNPDGSVNEARARNYALRLLRYSDTLRIWSIGFNSILYTNEYATLRLSSDGQVRYSAVTLSDREDSGLSEAYALARDFIADAALSPLNTELYTVLRRFTAIEGGYQFDFDYYCRGMRLITNAADTPALCVRVTKGIISYFSGDFVSVYWAELGPWAKEPTQYGMLIASLSENPLDTPEPVWALNADRFELSWSSADLLLPVRLYGPYANGEEVAE